MNNVDLGGNEILDIVKRAQYISDKLSIPAQRVGCLGISRGGYTTMRLMTFPGKVNGNEARFPFGFGVETAGFYDIIYQHYRSNIPDRTYLEADDPAVNHDKLIDRSALYHVAELTGPLLLCHSNAVNRIDIEGSKLMDCMLTHLGLPHRYVEFEGRAASTLILPRYSLPHRYVESKGRAASTSMLPRYSLPHRYVESEGREASTSMLPRYGLPRRYVEFEGMGQGIKDKEPQKKFYCEVFRFLDETEDGKKDKIKTEIYHQ